jgi:hypothetical protein
MSTKVNTPKNEANICASPRLHQIVPHLGRIPTGKFFEEPVIPNMQHRADQICAFIYLLLQILPSLSPSQPPSSYFTSVKSILYIAL